MTLATPASYDAPYRAVELPAKGTGLVASRCISTGEIVVQEDAPLEINMREVFSARQSGQDVDAMDVLEARFQVPTRGRAHRGV